MHVRRLCPYPPATMHKDWFPFFSMLFWCATKLLGLGVMMTGLGLVSALFAAGFSLWGLVSTLGTLAVGWVLLATEVAFDIGSAEMRRRLGAPK